VVHDLESGRREKVDGERVAQGHREVAQNLKREENQVKSVGQKCNQKYNYRRANKK
jgi:hypothetical protein